MSEQEKIDLTTVVHALMRVEHLRRSMLDTVVRRIGMTRNSHIVLMYLSRHEELPSQKEIAAHLSVSPGTVTGIMKSLEKDGLISRVQLENDNRYNEVQITEHGKEIVKQTFREFSALDAAEFNGIGEEELMSLYRTLLKMQNNMEKCKEEKLS